jgi:adenylate cyclase
MKALVRIAQAFSLGRIVCLLLLAGFVALRIWDPLPLKEIRLRTFDFFQQLKPRERNFRPVVIVDIDEQSLKAYGQWPWPRTLLAELVTKLTKLGSAAIGFDIIFAEPDRMSPALVAQGMHGLDEETREKLEKLPNNDAILADAIRHSRVVLGESGSPLAAPPSGAPAPSSGFAMMGGDPSPYLFSYPGILRNIPILDGAAAGRGLLNMRAEPDGIVRRIPLVMRAGGTIIPALTLEMLRVVTGAGAIRIATDAAGIRNVAVPGLLMPTDRNSQLWIYFAHYDPKLYVSAKDVLDGRVPADRFNRRLVLIGTSAVGLHDIRTTPIDPDLPGVDMHAQVLENILTKSTLERPNYTIGAELATAVVFSLVIIALAPILGAAMMLVMGGIVAAMLAAGSWYFFIQHHILLDATYPLLCSFAIYLALTFINYFREQMQRRRIRFAFGQYLAPSLVEQLAHSHETLVLGGEEREMTILFSDVRGFTTISEIYKDDPQGLTSLMNHFLTPMTNAIIEHKGTIDKYIGDAIMAFWNAPLRDPAQEIDACEAALAMLHRVETLNQRRKEEAAHGGHRFIPIKVGIGINTGRCVVGNMGSDLRFNYSVLGDTVNLASRLEGQSKTYGVPIILGAKTAQAAREKFAVLELDCITVKGKTEPETIFTVLGHADVARSERFDRLRQALEEMLALYRRRDFVGAAEAIASCRKADDGFDLVGLFDLYAERIDAFRRDPPPEDWNGVFAFEHK